MPTAPTASTPLFIQSAEALATCVADLRTHAVLSFDLEFDSNFRRYGVTLALIQIATPERCYLIDPLADLDLSAVWTVLEDSAIQKIVHSPGEDLRLLHAHKCYPQSLYDTEIPARLLNYERTSLTVMLEEKLGVTLSGGQQRSNWLARPLEPAQLTYAAADAVHLHPLKKELEKETADRGLAEFVADEQAALSRARYNVVERTNFLRPADERELSPYQQHILQALLRQRDGWARNRARPLFKISDEAAVRAIVTAPEAPTEEAARRAMVRGFDTPQYVEAVLKEYNRAAAEADSLGLSKNPPPRPRLSREERMAREQGARDRDEKFAPVQAALALRYGTFAARYILSNTLVGEITKHSDTLAGFDRPYRRDVILETAAELGISLEPYL